MFELTTTYYSFQIVRWDYFLITLILRMYWLKAYIRTEAWNAINTFKKPSDVMGYFLKIRILRMNNGRSLMSHCWTRSNQRSVCRFYLSTVKHPSFIHSFIHSFVHWVTPERWLYRFDRAQLLQPESIGSGSHGLLYNRSHLSYSKVECQPTRDHETDLHVRITSGGYIHVPV